MADAIQIRGSSYTGKIRNPLGVIGLSLITFGIYGMDLRTRRRTALALEMPPWRFRRRIHRSPFRLGWRQQAGCFQNIRIERFVALDDGRQLVWGRGLRSDAEIG